MTIRFDLYLPFRTPGRRSRLRRILARIAPSWAVNPLRRIVQACTAVLFFVLLCYVVWPYSAVPAPQWPGWTLTEVDAAAGRVILQGDVAPGALRRGTQLFLWYGRHNEPQVYGPFSVEEVGAASIRLIPSPEVSPDRLVALAEVFEPCTISTTDPRAWPSHYADDLARKEILPAETLLLIDPLVGVSTGLAACTPNKALWAGLAVLLLCAVFPRMFCGWICPLGTLIDAADGVITRVFGKKRSIAKAKATTTHLDGDAPAPAIAASSPCLSSVGRSIVEDVDASSVAATDAARIADEGVGSACGRPLRPVRFGILALIVAAATTGTVLTGYAAALPVLTRGTVALIRPAMTAMVRGSHQVPPWEFPHVAAAVILLSIFGLSLFGPRLWCRTLCPTGALCSLAGLARVTQRRVDHRCTHCGRCRDVCTFDAIEANHSFTRSADCTYCQDCGGVCPVEAIHFVPRFGFGPTPTTTDRREPLRNKTVGASDRAVPAALSAQLDRATADGSVPLRDGSRRAWLAAAAGGTAGALFGVLMPRVGGTNEAIIRPPGSLPEPLFSRTCVRCGNCIQACPNDALWPAGWEFGLDALWTPRLVAEWSGCESSCANCGQVCPTGAIRSLSLDEKRNTPLGLAVVDRTTCLPYTGRSDCRHCADVCDAAGHRAIEFVRVGTEFDEQGRPIEDTGFLAPVVLTERCVGCGQCENRCTTVNVLREHLLDRPAIRVRDNSLRAN